LASASSVRKRKSAENLQWKQKLLSKMCFPWVFHTYNITQSLCGSIMTIASEQRTFATMARSR